MTRLRALNLIDSQWQGTLGARAGDSVNPASGQEIGSFAASGRADAEQALDRYDEVLLHGSRRRGALAAGYFLSPTLVAQRDCAAASLHDEIFGPFVAIGQFDADSEALACVTRMSQVHPVSLWTGAVARVHSLALALALRHGRVRVNQHNWLSPRAGRAVQPGQRRPCGLLLDFMASPAAHCAGEAADEKGTPCKG
jgi:acyl-CoA reductase-like NAD-dependent aldehyde dehydrogenase